MEQLTLGGKVWGGLFPSRERGDLVCCLLSQEQAGEIWELLPSPKPSLAAIWGMDWNRDLSPWPAQPLFGREKFTGEGEGFCQVLTQELLPLARQILGEKPTTQSLVGYSLAGLFSLWALWQTGAFTRAASLSGSLWYEGWLEFLQSRPLLHRPEKVVLTLGGKREKHPQSPYGESGGKHPENCPILPSNWYPGHLGTKSRRPFPPGFPADCQGDCPADLPLMDKK